jgi:hypothetical protein
MSNPCDVDVVLRELAKVEAGISGVIGAYESAPDSIPATDLPAFINLPGPEQLVGEGGDDEIGEGLSTRTYYCVLIVAPFGTGISGEKFGDVMPFFTRVRDTFMRYQALGLANALRLVYRGDSGVLADIQYAGNSYYGIRFSVDIAGLFRVNYAQYE